MIRRSTSGRNDPHAEESSDAGLMTRMTGGDSGALGELYDRHQASLRRFLARATSDAADVDDLVHAAFLEAAKSAGRYDGRASCRPWLVGIAAQLLRRRRRAFGRFVAVLSSLGGVRSGVLDPRPGLQARTDVERALHALSEPKRITFLMAELEGLTCPEIADALNIPIGTVWTRLHAARRELRAALTCADPP
jgi:RNA polymerase sigma-70 factor, ECF subfamily